MNYRSFSFRFYMSYGSAVLKLSMFRSLGRVQTFMSQQEYGSMAVELLPEVKNDFCHFYFVVAGKVSAGSEHSE